MNAPLDDYRWLTSEEGAEWIRRAGEEGGSELKRATRLRKSLPAERARLVLQQVELRGRAAAKFPQAQRMFFTPVGLEQATDAWVAACKAARFPTGEPVADLCCGIGGDLLALAARGPAMAIDRDPVTALLAAANARAVVPEGVASSRATVVVADVAAFLPRSVAAWHLDPDRRPQGRRTTHVELHEPGLPVIEQLLEANDSASIKLAPAAEPPPAWSDRAELEWIGRDRQCRQLVAWFGRLARSPGKRRATILNEACETGALSTRTLVGVPDLRIATAAALRRYLYEPDAAVLAAGLSGALAAEHALEAIAPGIAYLTSDRAVVDSALAAFEVIETLPFDERRLKRLLRERGIGRLEIKKRGVDEDPQQLRRRLDLRGDAAAVLLLSPLGSNVVAILARRPYRATT
jgi:predicted RNA methylase